jgi:protein SCO1
MRKWTAIVVAIAALCGVIEGREGRPGGTAPARPTVDVSLPDITLTRTDGARVPLREVLSDRQPVVMNFIFTSCTTICPVMSATLSKFQAGLGSNRDDVKLVSISIDPEYDTPARLAEYAATLKRGPGWEFFTGSPGDIVAIQRAFGTYRGEKLSHEAVTFVRARGRQRWARVDGLVSAGQLKDAFVRAEAK